MDQLTLALPRAAFVLLAVFGVAGCGGSDDSSVLTPSLAHTGSNLGEDVEFIFEERELGLHEVQTLVVAEEGQPAWICTGDVADSIPPHCGDIRVSNWDWDNVRDEGREGGVRWGTFHFVGRRKGEEFEVVGFLD